MFARASEDGAAPAAPASPASAEGSNRGGRPSLDSQISLETGARVSMGHEGHSKLQLLDPPLEASAATSSGPAASAAIAATSCLWDVDVVSPRAPTRAKVLTTLHYNDVYNMESGKKEPVGGAARFAGMLAQQSDDPLVLFSGDALNPSMASTFFKVRPFNSHDLSILTKMPRVSEPGQNVNTRMQRTLTVAPHRRSLPRLTRRPLSPRSNNEVICGRCLLTDATTSKLWWQELGTFCSHFQGAYLGNAISNLVCPTFRECLAYAPFAPPATHRLVTVRSQLHANTYFPVHNRITKTRWPQP